VAPVRLHSSINPLRCAPNHLERCAPGVVAGEKAARRPLGTITGGLVVTFESLFLFVVLNSFTNSSDLGLYRLGIQSNSGS